MNPRFILLLAFLSAGCATFETQPQSLVGRTYAVLEFGKESGRVVDIDQHYSLNFLWGFPRQVNLAPGVHQIGVMTAPRPPMHLPPPSFAALWFVVEPGRRYEMRYDDGSGDPILAPAVWIVDVDSGSRVSRVMASVGESTGDGTTDLIKTQFFTWSPPAKENWRIAFPNTDQVIARLRNTGDDEIEIRINRIDVPPANDENEFARSIVGKWHGPPPDDDRFNVREDTATVYLGRSDFCARTKWAAIDARPSPRTIRTVLMAIVQAPLTRPINEVAVGYCCRMPTDHARGYCLEYSRRSFNDPRNPPMDEQVDRYFAAFKF